MDIITYLREKAKKAHEKANAEAEEAKKKQAAKEQGLQEIKDYLDKNTPANETPSYERFDYDSPSDEELKKSAEEELRGYEIGGENAIKNEFDELEKELNKNKVSSKELFDESNQKLKETYEKTAEALSNDALKRGLARSSIALNGQIAASSEYNKTASELLNEYNRKISDIDKELDGLGTELRKALDTFKIGYAAKLTERINELKSEREKSEREAIEYNNSLTQREYNERKAANKESSKLTEAQASEQSQREFYNKVNEVLNSLPLDVAKELFKEQRALFRDNLDDVYYNALYTRFA